MEENSKKEKKLYLYLSLSGLGIVLIGFIIALTPPYNYELGDVIMVIGGVVAITFGLIHFLGKKGKKAPIENDKALISNADELVKYKDLLDSGIITQEEFDAKKKQLLRL